MSQRKSVFVRSGSSRLRVAAFELTHRNGGADMFADVCEPAE